MISVATDVAALLNCANSAPCCHLSEHAAYGRIEAARAARKFPVVLDLLSDGSLTLTTVTLLATTADAGQPSRGARRRAAQAQAAGRRDRRAHAAKTGGSVNGAQAACTAGTARTDACAFCRAPCGRTRARLRSSTRSGPSPPPNVFVWSPREPDAHRYCADVDELVLPRDSAPCRPTAKRVSARH